MSPYGLTPKQIKHLSERLGDLLDVPPEEVSQSMDQITREEVMRIAKNEVEE